MSFILSKTAQDINSAPKAMQPTEEQTTPPPRKLRSGAVGQFKTCNLQEEENLGS